MPAAELRLVAVCAITKSRTPEMTRFTKGFTLIELIVVIVIMILLSGAGLAAYNYMNQRQLVRRAGSAVTDLLRLAQTKTLTGEKPSIGSCITDNLDGYQVRVDGKEFILEVVCGGTAQDADKGYRLMADIAVNSGSQVMFKVLAQGTTGESFCLSGYDWFYKIKVLTSGEVVEDGFVEACE